MEEIESLHNLSIEWGCITNLISKISDIEDEINGGWPELADMMADAVSEEEEGNADASALFFNLYQFLFRLYYRLKANPAKRPFNIISKTESAGEEVFLLQNYDYATFKWLKKIGVGSSISNDCAVVPIGKLSDKQRRAFERKAK